MSLAMPESISFRRFPKFHLALDWASRLSARAAGQDWAALSEAERAALIGAETDPRPGCVGLFRIAEHLRQRWWSSAEEWLSPESRPKALDAFSRELFTFTRFKDLPLGPDSSLEILVRNPEQEESRIGGARLRALVHLGDEECAIWLKAPAESRAFRLRLQPGDGILLPEGLEAHACATTGRTDIDVFLLIQRP